MNAHWRSRDGYKAAFMNMFALSELHKEFAKMLSEKTGREVRVGGYVDISDSYHIYGRDLRDFEKRFLKPLEEREFYPDRRISGSRGIYGRIIRWSGGRSRRRRSRGGRSGWGHEGGYSKNRSEWWLHIVLQQHPSRG